MMIGTIAPEVAARALQVVMEEISERCWCAGWMDNIEESLWEMVCDPEDKRPLGMCARRTIDVELLATLSDACGGWIAWDEGGGMVDGRPRFVPIAEWQRRVGTGGR